MAVYGFVYDCAGRGVDLVAEIDHVFGREWPAEDYHCKWDEHSERAQRPLCVQEPWGWVGLERCGFTGEGVGFSESVSEAGAECAVLREGLARCWMLK